MAATTERERKKEALQQIISWLDGEIESMSLELNAKRTERRQRAIEYLAIVEEEDEEDERS